MSSRSNSNRAGPTGIPIFAATLGLVVALGMCAGCTGATKFSTLKIVTVDDDAEVYVDGAYLGQVREVSGAQQLTPGVHRVEVRKPGRFPVQRTIRVDPKRPAEFSEIAAELLEDPR
jgi:hypothetical protein